MPGEVDDDAMALASGMVERRYHSVMFALKDRRVHI